MVQRVPGSIFYLHFIPLTDASHIHFFTEMLDRSIYKHPSQPSFKRAFEPELIQVPENLDKSFLKQILGIIRII
jgi:hypothetical protein